MTAEYGMVHGRFQPFHNEHLEYARKAAERCRRLIVGITNPDPSEVSPESTSLHRHLTENNPYTFFQRLQMVLGSLRDEGIDPHRLLVIPFHIHEPAKWRHYLPPSERLVHFVRVFSSWERAKVERIQAAGYAVEVLDPGIKKGIEASEIRRLLAAGDQRWRQMVPEAVAAVLDSLPALDSGIRRMD